MCGRFTRTSPIPTIAKRFSVKAILSPDLPPSYNIAPSLWTLIIANEGQRQLTPSRWGFLPSWAKDLSMGNRMINARSETVAEKRSFRHAFRNRRCLIVADGFYEWQSKEGKKLPMYIRLKKEEPFGFAGLYNNWQSPDSSAISTCTVITTEANKLIKPIHDRMPVILPRDKEDLWIDPSAGNSKTLQGLLMPYAAKEMVMYPVSARVNNPAYDSAENIRPA